MPRLLDRALAATRASRRIAFKPAFDAGSAQDWCEIVRDVVAMANSGGGVILFGTAPDRTRITEEIHRYTGVQFADFEIVENALVIEEARTPIVFSRAGPCGFEKGMLYFRHGAKSEPATTEDVDGAIKRRVNTLLRSWLSVKRVAVLPQEIRDSEDPRATPIRIVHDPRAPAFRLVDYDKTHPHRQKEVLHALRERLSELALNQFDLQAVRHIHHTDDNPDFAHKPVFGTRQYSAKFIDWVVEQVRRDPAFFQTAREQYIRTRRAAS
jgi:hypothetical protein